MRKSADELYHAWLKKGEKAKYIAKVYVGKGKYRYFYNNLEYKAYLAKQKLTKKVKETAKTAEKKISKALGINTVQKLNLTSKMKLSELSAPMVSKGKEMVKKWNTDRTVKDAIEKFKYIAKVELPNGLTRYFYSLSDIDSFYNRKKYQENEPYFLKDVPETKETMTKEEEMAEINEGYEASLKTGSDLRTRNCRLCSVAYEMRMRGYDVEADVFEEKDYVEYQSIVGAHSIYILPKIELDSTPDTIIEDLSKHPNTRGELSVVWKNSSSGHSVVYEVDHSGYVTLRDCQTNTVYYENAKDVVNSADSRKATNTKAGTYDDILDRTDTVAYIRTDNLTFRKGVFNCVQNN